MTVQWCEQQPCRGAMCPDATKRQGEPTFGHTIPVPRQPHDRATIINLMERHLAEAAVRDEHGLRHVMPPEFEFTIHHMVLTDGREYYAALYSGAANPMPLLASAPLAPPPGAPHGAAGALGQPGASGPPAPPMGGRWDADSSAISDRMDTLTSDHLPPEPAELDPQPVATQPRAW